MQLWSLQLYLNVLIISKWTHIPDTKLKTKSIQIDQEVNFRKRPHTTRMILHDLAQVFYYCRGCSSGMWPFWVAFVPAPCRRAWTSARPQSAVPCGGPDVSGGIIHTHTLIKVPIWPHVHTLSLENTQSMLAWTHQRLTLYSRRLFLFLWCSLLLFLLWHYPTSVANWHLIHTHTHALTMERQWATVQDIIEVWHRRKPTETGSATEIPNKKDPFISQLLWVHTDKVKGSLTALGPLSLPSYRSAEGWYYSSPKWNKTQRNISSALF